MAREVHPTEGLAAEYTAASEAYARHWAPVIRPLASPVLDALPLGSARRVLDVGSGTGSHLGDLERAAPGAKVIGVDRSEGMLRIARRNATCPLAVMDAANPALRPAAFDVATLIFMLFHMPDPPAALGAVRLALKLGGVVGVVTWGCDPGLPGLSIWAEELDAQGAGPDTRDASVMQHARMDSPQKLEELLLDAGFDTVRTWCDSFEHHWRRDELLALQLGCGAAARRLARLSAAAVSECRTRVESRLARLPDAALVYRPEVVYAVARRSS